MIAARFVFLPRPAKGLLFLRSQFQATYGRTLEDLERELGHLDAVDITIQAGFPTSKIRNDGWPYSSARPDHPGVVLQFRQGKDILTFRSLKYGTFEENLRAIALTMDALRRVDRYGVVEGEQYQGFKRLEAGDPKDAAVEFIKAASGLKAGSMDEHYKAAARKLHPDLGGSHDEFVRLQSAWHQIKGAA